MSGKKSWKIARADLKPGHKNKPDNPDKIAALYDLIDGLTDRADSQVVTRVSRHVVEEVVNILQHNPTWNDLELQTKINTTGSLFVFHITYDGGRYYNPDALGHVVFKNTDDKVLSYHRTYNVNGNGTVEIEVRIEIALK